MSSQGSRTGTCIPRLPCEAAREFFQQPCLDAAGSDSDSQVVESSLEDKHLTSKQSWASRISRVMFSLQMMSLTRKEATILAIKLRMLSGGPNCPV